MISRSEKIGSPFDTARGLHHLQTVSPCQVMLTLLAETDWPPGNKFIEKLKNTLLIHV